MSRESTLQNLDQTSIVAMQRLVGHVRTKELELQTQRDMDAPERVVEMEPER